ncbi:DUF2357 domain-containing protein [Sporolactobacillus terrae]|uniref:DUF2357 domain-containing protein n=1 Tax=Sporolactobacillus terrae TaxID=269673 RepID=UPI00048CB443|nr:DUF2357 domain-containing protein [Sporolactobacillus terrae]
MDIHFNVMIFEGNYRPIHLKFFNDKDALKTISDNDIPCFKEYANLAFKFTSDNPEDKLYMDGFEFLNDFSLRKDITGHMYVSPSYNKIVLYDGNNKQNPQVPFIPGYYEIKVDLSNSEKFYSWFKIQPNHLNATDWNRMQEEIESIVKGLANTFVRRENAFSRHIHDGFNDLFLMQKIDIVQKHLNNIRRSLKGIEQNPRLNIRKKYKWVKSFEKVIIDTKTIMQHSKHPEKKDNIYSAERYINYDTPENECLKKILLYFIHFSSESLDYLYKLLENLEEKYSTSYTHPNSLQEEIKSVNKSIDVIKRLRSYMQNMYMLDWMESIKEKGNLGVSQTIRMDSRYNYLFKVYRLLHDKNNSLTLSNEYQYFWKRTDLLYEIWGYIKMIQIIQALGYDAKDGWIFDEKWLGKQYLPFLNDDTTVQFNKDDITLNLIYNSEMPSKSEDTKPSKPLYSKSANRKPDIRLDIFRVNEYVGSLILDTKYRRLNNILLNNYDFYNHRSTMEQLGNYKNYPESIYFLKDKPDFFRKGSKPVSEVWVLYPGSDDVSQSIVDKIDLEDNIKFIVLRPGIDTEELSKKLEVVINEKIQYVSYGSV